MKLIIDISEQEYNECKNLFNMVYQEGYLNYNLNTSLIMYIANGTPLPKGHGRLIDADRLKEEMEKDVRRAMSFIDLTDFVWLAPTIIEEDKEE